MGKGKAVSVYETPLFQGLPHRFMLTSKRWVHKAKSGRPNEQNQTVENFDRTAETKGPK